MTLTGAGEDANATGLVTLPASSASECRMGTAGVLTLELVTKSRHGLSGDRTLANITFTRLLTTSTALTPTVVRLLA